MAHEKANEINGPGTSSGPTIIIIYQLVMRWFATRFANRFAKQWFARYQPHDSVHTLHSQTHLRRFPGIELCMVDVIVAENVHHLPGGCLRFGEIDPE